MVKLSLTSWLNPSSNNRTDEAAAVAERKKQNRRTFSGFSTNSPKSSSPPKTTNGKSSSPLQEKSSSLPPKESRPFLSTQTTRTTSNVEPTSKNPPTTTAATMPTADTNTIANTTSMTALADIISKETAKLEAYLKENNLPMPSFDVDTAADDFPKLPEDMQKSRLAVIHATKQLRDLTVGPRESLRWGVWEFLDVLALQIINNYGLAKLVPMDKPISLPDLAKLTSLDPVNLARTLRTAMTNHVFHEPQPGHIAHTAASRLLATDTDLAAWIGFNAEDIFPAAAAGVLPALHKYPEATSLVQTGFNFAFDTVNVEPMFATFGKDAARAKRMGLAMASLTGGEGYEVKYLVDNCDLSEVDARGGKFVDVGGSHGFVCVDLARKWKNIRFVCQDLQKTVESAPIPVCEDGEISQRVEFMAHDFFTEQRVEADVYYFRWIMHNYSTPYAISILKNLLPSLKPGARVIINDHCLREAGQETAWDDKIMRRMDMVMLTLLNAQERTEAEFRDLFRDVDEGFVFKGVTRPKGCRMSIIEAVWKPEEATGAVQAEAVQTDTTENNKIEEVKQEEVEETAKEA